MDSLVLRHPIICTEFNVRSFHSARKTAKERQLAEGRGGKGQEGSKSHNGQKAWFSTNNSILSAAANSAKHIEIATF
jgi:hypothetical protein